MLRKRLRQFGHDDGAAVAPTVALSLVALIAAGGLAFDYARLAALDSELQAAADQAALAAAGQLDGQAGAIGRAMTAAGAGGAGLAANRTRFANDGGGLAITIQSVVACSNFDDSGADSSAACTITGDDADARVAMVSVSPREAVYTLTPIVALFRSGQVSAQAVAGVRAGICKVPPIMVCNPQEPAGNQDENMPFGALSGTGLRLIAGNAAAPGNFGWLESDIGNGASGLAGALGYDDPPGRCQPITNVTTKTGMDSSVLKALNTRLDVYANGNSTCPAQFGGDCSPSRNTRKDLVCRGRVAGGAVAGCANDSWSVSARPYRPASAGPLPASGSEDPDVMGYPRDYCHAVASGAQTCGPSGNGDWDRDAYFRVNYGWMSRAAWMAGTGLTSNATRYQVYNWEMAHPSVAVNGVPHGINVPQPGGGANYAFGSPATGRTGITPDATTVDRRRLTVAVLNCRAINLHGKTTNIPVPQWLDIFLTEPSLNRSGYTDQKEVYAEVIGPSLEGAGEGATSQLVRRDVPYLIR